MTLAAVLSSFTERFAFTRKDNQKGDHDMSEYLSPKQAAEKFNLSEPTMRQWRMRGEGPAYTKAGALVRYRAEDIEAWLNAARVETAQR